MRFGKPVYVEPTTPDQRTKYDPQPSFHFNHQPRGPNLFTRPVTLSNPHRPSPSESDSDTAHPRLQYSTHKNTPSNLTSSFLEHEPRFNAVKFPESPGWGSQTLGWDYVYI